MGSPQEVEKQLEEIYLKAGLDPATTDFLKFVPNVELLEAQQPKTEKKSDSTPQSASPTKKSSSQRKTTQTGGFSIENIKLGESYDGYVKLTYNYGIFVTVKGVEGLLHKKQIVTPDNVDWKKYYNIGDKITVKAFEFKDINGEKRVVRTQK